MQTLTFSQAKRLPEAHHCLCRERLKPCSDGWPAEGQSDDAGTSVGGELALRAEALSAFQEHFAKRAFLGEKQAVASFRSVVAIGMSSGVLLVLMPRGLNAQGAPTGCVPFIPGSLGACLIHVAFVNKQQ